MQPNRSEPPGGSNHKINNNQTKSTREFRGQKSGSTKRTSPATREQSARLNYERYLAQAQAEARSGNLVEAENCYQHAEHYFRAINNHAG